VSLNPEQVLELVVDALEAKKAINLVTLNLQGISLIADYFVICHGNSETQVQALASAVREAVNAQSVRIRSLEGMNTARWILLDLGDVVVHVFHRDEREYYHIERLWSDAKVVERV